MTEKLIIHNFCGIKSAIIEPKPITIFIGQQASGKSITAKLLYFFRNLGNELYAAAIDKLEEDAFISAIVSLFNRIFPLIAPAQKFEITYEINDYIMRVQGTPRRDSHMAVNFKMGDFFQRSLNQYSQDSLEAIRANKPSASKVLVQTKLQNELKKAIAGTLGFHSVRDNIFIPAGRTIFSQLKASFFESSSSREVFDPFLVRFSNWLDICRIFLEGADHEGYLADAFPREVSKVLQAQPERKEQQVFLLSENRRVPLTSASSGQQEVWPLLLLLSMFMKTKWNGTLYVEEPEVHLFPKTQRDIVEFLANVFNHCKIPNFSTSQIITTHSPYILTSFNNLIQAGIAYRKYADHDELKQKLEKIVPASKAIYPEEITAYAFADGGVTSIIDQETGLINAHYIDSVSEIIAEEFDKLLWLE
ncbi:MAG: ATP-binding protein [Verrucomicrobiales bacterium]|jgi:hypothetical protein|nr:ATP-binding protein [Verrucomicrobiales bacterium]